MAPDVDQLDESGGKCGMHILQAELRIRNECCGRALGAIWDIWEEFLNVSETSVCKDAE